MLNFRLTALGFFDVQILVSPVEVIDVKSDEFGDSDSGIQYDYTRGIISVRSPAGGFFNGL